MILPELILSTSILSLALFVWAVLAKYKKEGKTRFSGRISLYIYVWPRGVYEDLYNCPWGDLIQLGCRLMGIYLKYDLIIELYRSACLELIRMCYVVYIYIHDTLRNTYFKGWPGSVLENDFWVCPIERFLGPPQPLPLLSILYMTKLVFI